MAISMLENVPALDGGVEAALERLPTVYFSHGYDAGYRQAVGDLLAALLPLSEQFIGEQPSRAGELREVLYRFEAFLEDRLVEMTPDRSYVEGGLGI